MAGTEKLIDVAAGRQPADLVFKNANVVDVFTGEIYTADVAVANGVIAGVGRYSGAEERDCTDRWLCPGFVDAHLHIESTMVLPAELVRAALPWGTTTMVADPHEIVNVCGAGGMRFMLDASEHLPCNLYFMLPSSVPSTPFETAGASFTAADMAPFVGHPRVLGLGEVMCYPDVIAARGDILDKLSLLRRFPIDGHAPSVGGMELQAYAAAGIGSDHECTTFAEAAEKARAGLAILIREGSAAHDLTTLVRGLLESGMPFDRFAFCTDDKHLDDIFRDGHIRWNIRLAIDLGMKPADAIRMATLNAARIYNLRGIGAIAPGYKADIVLLQDLKQVEIEAVYKDGLEAPQALGKLFVAAQSAIDPEILHSVRVGEVTVDRLALPVSGEADVIEMVPYQLITRRLQKAVPAQDGYFVPDATYAKLCVVERHGKGGGLAVAPLKGYNICGGAVATTVAHDSHNIIAAGDNDADIALAINRLREINGGYVLVKKGRVAGDLPLPVAGLMSLANAQEVQQRTGELIAAAHSMGIPYYIDPFISLSFLALPVIPAIRLTDKGLFDVERFEIIRRR